MVCKLIMFGSVVHISYTWTLGQALHLPFVSILYFCDNAIFIFGSSMALLNKLFFFFLNSSLIKCLSFVVGCPME